MTTQILSTSSQHYEAIKSLWYCVINSRDVSEGEEKLHTCSDGRIILKFGTVEEYIGLFCSEAAGIVLVCTLLLDQSTVTHFVLGIDQVYPIEDVLQILVKMPSEFSPEPEQWTKFRVVNIIKKWIEINPDDLNRKKFSSVFDDYLTILMKKDRKIFDFINKTLLLTRNTDPINLIEPVQIPTEDDIMKWDPQEIARQLTLIDYDLLSKLKYKEMLNERWMKDKAPSLAAITDRVNKLAYWLAHNVIKLNDQKSRQKMVTHLLNVSQELVYMNNFGSLMAFYLCFNLACMEKSRPTWQIPKHESMLRRLDLMSHFGNYSNYRMFIESKSPPMIPFIDVTLKDLLYHNETKQDYISKPKKLINIQKVDAIGELIEHVDIMYDILEALPELDIAELLEFSLMDDSRTHDLTLELSDSSTTESRTPRIRSTRSASSTKKRTVKFSTKRSARDFYTTN